MMTHPTKKIFMDPQLPSATKDIWVEVYGFVSWIMSFLCFGIYILWALALDSALESYGILHYPTK